MASSEDDNHSHVSRRMLAFVIISNGIFVVIEVIVGIMAGSLALLSDAGHNASHALVFILILFGMRVASAGPNAFKTYGHGRGEVLTALVSAILLGGVSLFIIYEAFLRFFQPVAVMGEALMVVSIADIAVDSFIAFLLSRKMHTLTMRSTFWHLVSDASSSIGLIGAGLVIMFTRWYYADPLIAMVIAAFMLIPAFRMARQAVHILMEGVPSHIRLEDVRSAMMAHESVEKVHDLHVWTLGSAREETVLSAHVIIRSRGGNADRTRKELSEILLANFGIRHSTIQFEFEKCDSSHE